MVKDIEQNWKRLTTDLVSKEEAMSHLQNKIIKLMPRTNLPSELKGSYENIFKKKSRKDILEVISHRSTQYSTQVFPAALTRKRAPNFWLDGERSVPLEDEAWKAIYLLFSSVSIGNTFINLDNVGKKGRIAWRRQLFSEDPSQFYHGVRNALGIRSKNWNQFFIALLAISYFTYRMRERVLKGEMGLEDYLNRLNEEYKISDDTTLLLFQLGREKKEIHYFSKFTSFISKWFKDYIERREDRPSLVTFLDSLTATSPSSKKTKLISSLREKLIFHLLKHNNINGGLLSQLVTMKINDDLKIQRPYGISDAKQFFAKL